MAMLCAISGTVPEQPVISKKSGHVFEKTLITKYIAETGKCPITGLDLAEDDLAQVRMMLSTAADVTVLLNNKLNKSSCLHQPEDWDGPAVFSTVNVLSRSSHTQLVLLLLLLL
jgi:hypothetical protein